MRINSPVEISVSDFTLRCSCLADVEQLIDQGGDCYVLQFICCAGIRADRAGPVGLKLAGEQSMTPQNGYVGLTVYLVSQTDT
ncbi:hypothetical protein [Sphingobacterium thalpophilum]|uniref:hypothetical protein n=1 Tax=Sphingobacterium thalpophilum TaxID=259 RepID=UPI0024A679DD|nr:hypothetical protein [Sphingobacterium thalpophilum]